MTDPHASTTGGKFGPAAGQARLIVEGDRPLPGRRQFLAWLTGGSLVTVSALALGQVVRFLAFEPAAEAPTAIPIGQPDSYALAALTYIGAARAYIGRDSAGLYALDAVCTHLGCLVEQSAGGGFACPCHGSHFSADGQVQSGPASKALRHLALELNQDGQVVVDRARPVAAETRLAINA
ncbi:MAG: ubiquinol-cytochrome c reductase iron-sulfur subunit [Chloroflexi bacterium]|nr:ubiquinol-cytochrome c reductase iron-sulfur subunit [Chloroflexota bacterium]